MSEFRHTQVISRGMTTKNYWRSVLAVLSGTAMAQALPVLGSLIIARLYAPEDFGIYSAWLGAVSMVAIVLTGRFELALALEADGPPRKIAVFAALLTLLAAFALLCSALLLFWLLMPDFFTSTSLALAAAFAPTALLIASVQIWLSWAAAEGSYRTLSQLRIIQAGGITVLQLLAGIGFASAESLAAAHLLGLLLATLAALHQLPLPLPAPPRAPLVLAFWSKHRRFPLLALPADSLNMACAQLPLLIVASRFGAEFAGYLALTMRTLGVSFGLLGTAVLDVFKRQASNSYRENGDCKDDFVRTFRMLMLGSVLACSAIALVSEDLFALGFGERWRTAGLIALWMLPLYALRLVASPLSYTFYIAGKQHLDLVWQIGLLAMTLSTLYLPPSPAAALQLYSLGYSFMYVVYLILSYRFSLGVAR